MIPSMPQVTLEKLISGAQSGLLVSFPTDTVPALAALPEKANLIFTAKQRNPDKPLILMAATAEDLWPYIQGSKPEWQELANKYWPGALTLVLPASYRTPSTMSPMEPTSIGIRVPNHAIAQTILAQTGPLATTSVNLSGQLPLQTVEEITSYFPEILTLKSTEYRGLGVPSTVARWTGDHWEILRAGAVKLLPSHP